jgi:hypothetical protein
MPMYKANSSLNLKAAGQTSKSRSRVQKLRYQFLKRKVLLQLINTRNTRYDKD